MKNVLTLITFLFLTFSLWADKNQNINRIRVEKPTFKIIGLDTTEIIRIPPPTKFLNKSANEKSGINIKVNYTGFNSQARRAFQYAVDIWSSMITSPVEIIIDANWIELEQGTLGQCGPTYYYRNYDGMPDNDVYYPITLAEKLYNDQLNDEGEADIFAEFNSNYDWYYGTDGDTPGDKFDLVSIVLHELCHGLGFNGSFSVVGSKGSWGWGLDSPLAFDRFIVDLSGNHLIDESKYPNNSKELKEILTSGFLYFDSPILVEEFGSKVYLYAPSTWDNGSSIYHLSNFYQNTENTLMCYSISKGKSIHDPGVIALSILEDIGWKHMHIIHDELKYVEDITDVEVVADISPDFDTNVFDPTLYYSIDSANYIKVPFSIKGTSVNTYHATIPISSSCDISYYITAGDKYDRDYKIPVYAPETNFHFFVGADTIPPEIKHYYNTFLNPGQDSISFQAYVTDDFGVDTVWIEYNVNGQEQSPVGVPRIKDDKFQMALDISSFGLDVGDSLSYRMFARDISKAGNIAVTPDSGEITLNVEEIPEFITSLKTEFELGNTDFILQGFNIFTSTGFKNGALHTEHPYEFAGEDNSLDYIAQLRYPVKIDKDNHYIEFDEIVLVEPGESGYEYGDDEFWDYVIVEVSKTEGATWTPIEPGWDSRLHDDWEEIYNQSLNEQYSQAVGTPDMYKHHVMDILDGERLKANDEILIRFRLYSDPYAYGWGWAIDNLKIQTEGLRADFFKENLAVKVYPNPVEGNTLHIEPRGQKLQEVTLYNFSGSRIVSYNDINQTSEYQVELPDYLHGGYIVVIKTDATTERHKLLIE